MRKAIATAKKNVPHRQTSPGTKIFAVLALVAGVSLSAGCSVGLPNFRRPGHIYQQQLRATYHDPYASVSGAPEIDGGRPDSYVLPRALPVQSQWYN